MSLGDTIVTLSNWLGWNLYYIFKFFEKLSKGYVAFMFVITVFLLILFFFRFTSNEMKRVVKD